MKRDITEITLSGYNIEQRLFTYSYYVGEARHSIGAPMQQTAGIQASSDDHTQIGDHIRMAMTEIVNLINRYMATCSCAEKNDTEHDGHELFTLSFIPPTNYPGELLEELQKAMESYVVMRTLAMWMTQHKPDEAILTSSEADKLSLQLRELMNCRNKPRKAVTRRRKNIEI